MQSQQKRAAGYGTREIENLESLSDGDCDTHSIDMNKINSIEQGAYIRMNTYENDEFYKSSEKRDVRNNQ